MSLKWRSYPLLSGLRTTAWKLTWQKHKDNANGRKYGRYVYPNILKAFENKRYDRIWKGPFNREVSYYFLRPMRKHLTSSPYITAKKQKVWSAKQTPSCASRFFVTLLHENFLILIFMEDVIQSSLVLYCTVLYCTFLYWILYCKFRKIHVLFSKFSNEMVLMAMKFETARIHFF